LFADEPGVKSNPGISGGSFIYSVNYGRIGRKKGGLIDMNIRYSDSNWARFKTHNKKTTTRATQRKDGLYDRVRGSYFKPIKTGEQVEIKFLYSKPIGALTPYDAVLDGFDTLQEFIDELMKLNPKFTAATVVYIHENKVI
jgi:hypothetical protein